MLDRCPAKGGSSRGVSIRARRACETWLSIIYAPARRENRHPHYPLPATCRRPALRLFGPPRTTRGSSSLKESAATHQLSWVQGLLPARGFRLPVRGNLDWCWPNLVRSLVELAHHAAFAIWAFTFASRGYWAIGLRGRVNVEDGSRIWQSEATGARSGLPG